MTRAALVDPVDTDTQLADLYDAAWALRDRIALLEESAKAMAGATFRYRGRRRVAAMDAGDAERILHAALTDLTGDHAPLPTSAGYRAGQARRCLDELTRRRADLHEIEAQAAPLERLHRDQRWSRFFLVVSSNGHIHASRACSTCRPSTRFGWLPQLSGATEQQAVDAYGPALCSVCFPAAPTAWTTTQLTRAAAARAAH